MQSPMKRNPIHPNALLHVALAAALAGTAHAESIAFVASFTSTYHTADTIALLQSAGHTVTVVPANTVNGTLTTTHTASGLTKKAYLESFGMVLLSRASASGDYTDKAGWAALEVPVMSMNAYAVRGTDRLHWFSAAASDQGPADPDSIVTNSTHPIWAGVTLTATNTRANLFVPLSGNNVSGGSGTFGNGTLLGTSTGGANVSTIVAWEDGAQFASGLIAADRRVFFAGGGYATFVEDGTQTGSNTAPLNADGDKAFLNAVQWVLANDPNPDSDFDGLLDIWENQNFGNLTQTATGDPDGDGHNNLAEFNASSNPNLAVSVPGDIDGDAFADSVELQYFNGLTETPGGDFDHDYVSNATEIAAGKSPVDARIWPDADADSMSDGWETANGLNPAVNDAGLDLDSDGSSNLAEFLAGSDPQDSSWTPTKAKIKHRWSFTNDLLDSVGTSHAQIVNPDNDPLTGGAGTLDASGVTLQGGNKDQSDYLLLGSNLLSSLQSGGSKPVTIELWATPVSLMNWSRVFSFGVSANPGNDQELAMTWSQGTNANTDRVLWNGRANQDNTVAAYQLNRPYHVVMTIVPAVFTSGALASGARVTWYAAPASGSQPEGHPLFSSKGTFNVTSDLSALVDSVCVLGRSAFADATASASYDEMRIWAGALTDSERKLFQLIGPDNMDRSDSDSDGFPDAWELARFGNLVTAAVGADSDGDGDKDEAEYAAETHPNKASSTVLDSDGDGLQDLAFEMQYFKHLLFWGDEDPDSDGITNEEEQTGGSNPANANSSPDFDGDGLPDGWELRYFFDTTSNDGDDDPDGDAAAGISNNNLAEYQHGTDPTSEFSGVDTDADTLPDFWEHTYFGPNPGYLIYGGANDPDGDTVSNAQEFADRTNPNNGSDFKDSNADGYPDGKVLVATDGIGASSFNAGTNWPNTAAPAAGSNYLVTNGFTLRTPNVANQTTVFAGDRLALASGALWLKGGNSIAQANYVFDGVTVRNAEDAGNQVTLAGNIQTVDPSVIFADNGNVILTAKITGSGGLTLNGNVTAIRQVLFNNATNTWTGPLTMNQTASLIVNGVLSPATGSVYHLAPKAAGVTNSVGGTGILNLAGTFDIDLTAATPTASVMTWNLLTTTTRIFNPGFTVTGSGFTSNAASVGSRIWTSGDGNYVFDESTGVLSFIGTLPGFVAWAGSAGLTAGINDGAEQNPEGDAYANVLEYQLGGSPLVFDGDLVTATQNATYLIFTFERFDASENDSTLSFRWGADLGAWNTVPIGMFSSGPDANGVIVTVTEDGGSSADYDLIQIQLPKSKALGGKLFGRLQGTQP